ncbi:two pore potassium channel c-like [Miscanthus floridulus]|uniref:two pore potassium channel c-like n=1 Tax=Miscanthus floridulus TaxID=154761 RepID=UPI00345946EE
MDTEPLLPTHLLHSLPEHSEVSHFSSPPSPSCPSPAASYKDRIIFGARPPPQNPPQQPPPPPPPPPPPRSHRAHHRRSSSIDGLHDLDLPSCSSSPPSDPEDPSSAAGAGAPSLFEFIANAAGARTNLHRSRTAPAMAPLSAAALAAASATGDQAPEPPKRPAIVLHAFLFLLAYLALGVAFYAAAPANFTPSAGPTHPVADALYFCIVTLCTIGYGDITPATPAAKLFSISFVLVGFGFVDILLSGMVSYVLDLQEHLLITALKNPTSARKHRHNYIFDIKKGRMRIRMKVALALGVVAVCVGVGAAVLRKVESLGWLDAVYLAVMSVTTVGYGDQAFQTLVGRLFASAWLLVSTLAVARAFLYLAEMRIDKRHRAMANWVLSRDMTVSEFLAADIDNNGYVTKSEFVVYKLKEMGKISEKDIMMICDQFQRLDTGNCGKIKLSDLLESHHLVSEPRDKKKGKKS